MATQHSSERDGMATDINMPNMMAKHEAALNVVARGPQIINCEISKSNLYGHPPRSLSKRITELSNHMVSFII